MRIGVHVSIAGKIYESVDRAAALGCDTMQIFSRNPRSWKASAISEEDAGEFKRRAEEKNIRPVVVHIPYLINLATPDSALYRKSIRAFRDDLKRADHLGADYFVTHLGSHVKSGEEAGLRRLTDALNEIIKTARPRVMILLEVTAGSGSWLGYRFGHIRRIMDGLRVSENIGVCIDTAHLFSAGYDIKTKQGLQKTLGDLDRLIGLEKARVVHFNDSKAAMRSMVDRHEHIGKGLIGLAALSRVINHPRLKNAAFIMETPKESDRDDRRNLKIARGLVKRRI